MDKKRAIFILRNKIKRSSPLDQYNYYFTNRFNLVNRKEIVKSKDLTIAFKSKLCDSWI